MMYPFVKTEKVGFLKCKVSFLVDTGGYAIPCPFFAWYRHPGVTPPSQGRAGAILNCRAKRLHHDGPSHARLGLDRWGKLCRPEPGYQALFPSGSVWWIAQLWPQGQHLLNRCHASFDTASCDMPHVLAQS